MDYDYEEIHNLVKKSVYNTKRYYRVDRIVGKYIDILRQVFNYDRDDLHDLIQDITIFCVTPGERKGKVPMDWYDPKKAGLYTFINLQVYGCVFRKVRSLYGKRKHGREVLESDIGEKDFNILEFIADIKATPEDLVIIKEGLDYMREEFGEDFIDIVLKEKTQTEIAGERGMSRGGISYRYIRDLEKMKDRDDIGG